MIMNYFDDNVKVTAAIHIEGCGAFLGTEFPPTASIIITGCDDEPTIRLDSLTRTDLERLKAGIKHAEDVLREGSS